MPQIIVVLLSIILFALILKPIILINAYFFFRPLVHPFGLEHLKLLSLPINTPFAFVIVLSVFPFGFFRRKFKLIQNNTLILYFLIFFSILSWAYSINLIVSIAQSVKFLNALALALLAANAVSSRQQIMRVYQGIVLSSIIPMMYGYYQYVTSTGHVVQHEQTDRITSFFGFANLYGIFLALIMFCSLILYFDTNKKFNKTLYGVIIVSAMASTILALNRGSWVAIFAGFMLSFPFYRKYLNIKWFVIIVTLIVLTSSWIIIQRFLELSDPYRDTFGGRLELGQLIIQAVGKVPILGYGAGTAEIALEKIFGHPYVPHDDYLRLFLEMGIIGPVLYIIFLMKELIGNLRVRTFSDSWHVNYFTLAMILYWIIISSAQNIIHDAVVFPLFLVCCQLAKKYVSLRGGTS